MSTTPSTDSDTNIETSFDMFQEPEDFYPSEPEPTFIDFHRNSKFIQSPDEPATINLRLVGKSPLWGHLLWNAGKLTTDYLDEHRDVLVRGKTVLELGAAAALPSIVAALSADKVVVTDYPDPELIENIRYNIINGGLPKDIVQKVSVLGYIWGNDVSEILEPIQDGSESKKKFDLMILSDLIFNHSEHTKLIRSMDEALAPDGKALVVFSPHRPKLYNKDLAFFDLAKELANFEVVEKFEKDYMPMFEEDEETKELRGKAFGYILQRGPKN